MPSVDYQERKLVCVCVCVYDRGGQIRDGCIYLLFPAFYILVKSFFVQPKVLIGAQQTQTSRFTI